MNKTAEVFAAAGVALAALTGSAGAQNSQGNAMIDSGLRAAIERKDVPGVVALVTDRERVLYQGAFGVADVSTGRALTEDAVVRQKAFNVVDDFRKTSSPYIYVFGKTFGKVLVDATGTEIVRVHARAAHTLAKLHHNLALFKAP